MSGKLPKPVEAMVSIEDLINAIIWKSKIDSQDIAQFHYVNDEIERAKSRLVAALTQLEAK